MYTINNNKNAAGVSVFSNDYVTAGEHPSRLQQQGSSLKLWTHREYKVE